ncbi:MAG: HU family DNA-binding protein [Mangrovibacterium sp.]
MTVKYRLIKQATPGVKGGGQYKYYARACERQKASIDDLADLLAKRSSLSHGDIVATLYGLAHLIPELLLENRTVELGELGTFSLNLKSVGAEQPRIDGYRLIKGAEISFRPSLRLKQAVRNVDYTKSKSSTW